MTPRRSAAVAAAVLAALLSSPGAALAQETTARFDPRDWRERVAGQRTQVLVLGSPHLSGAPRTFDPEVLEPLLSRLEAFRPDVVAIEALSGESLQALKAYEAVYPDSAESFGVRSLAAAAKASAESGLDLPAAEAALRARLAEWPDAPTPADRRALAALFAASGDPYSALVQWWRLPEAERRAGDGVGVDLAADLQAFDRRRNENHLVGSRLATRLGLERVWPIDDHAADDVMTPAVVQALSAAMSDDPAVAALMADPRLARLGAAGERLTTPEQALETYRELNTLETAALDARLQWLIMIEREWPQGAGRVRMAEWEARNLRQVAHIREAAAQAPGGRVLVIVGSAHKAWFEAYLGMMPDIALVDASVVLR